MNEFSLVCRVLGTLFHRAPNDEVVLPLVTSIEKGQVIQSWPLEQDELWTNMQQHVDMNVITADYQQLFSGDKPAVANQRQHIVEGIDSDNDIREFLVKRGMTLSPYPMDPFGHLLLSASWLEDQETEDGTLALIQFFDTFILPWSDIFLENVDIHANTHFYRGLSHITQEALVALREELD